MEGRSESLVGHKTFYERFVSFLKFYEGFRSCKLSVLLKPFHPEPVFMIHSNAKEVNNAKRVSNKGHIEIYVQALNICSGTK